MNVCGMKHKPKHFKYDPHEQREDKDVKKIKKAASDIEKQQPKSKSKPKRKK
jgi:hypothetical protein